MLSTTALTAERCRVATLTVRNLDEDVVRRLRIRAAEHGRSAEAEHREILKAALIARNRSEHSTEWDWLDEIVGKADEDFLAALEEDPGEQPPVSFDGPS